MPRFRRHRRNLESSRSPLYRKEFEAGRNVRLFYVLGFVRELSPLVVIWVVYLTDYRHLTLTQVGVMEGLFWSVKLAAEVPSGAFADRFGRRQTFFAGLALEALGVLLFAFAGGFLLLTVSYGVWAAGLAFRSGNEEAYLYDALAADGRQSEFGDRFGLYSALSVAAVLLGGLSGGVIAEATNLQIAVVACLAPYVLMTPVLLLMQEPPRALAASRPRGYWGTVRDAVGVVRRDRGAGPDVVAAGDVLRGAAGLLPARAAVHGPAPCAVRALRRADGAGTHRVGGRGAWSAAGRCAGSGCARCSRPRWWPGPAGCCCWRPWTMWWPSRVWPSSWGRRVSPSRPAART